MSPGEFTSLVRAAVEGGAELVGIDSLNAFMQSMPGEKFLVQQMHELLAFLNQKGVITFVVLGQHGITGHSASTAVDLSYLSDCVVLLRYFEANGEVRKAMTVVKTRTAGPERTVREVTLASPGGLVVGDPLTGALVGVPVWDGLLPGASAGRPV